MYCRNCGKEINEETQFCPACGSKQNGGASNASNDDPFTTTTTPIEDDKPAKCWSVFALIGKILGIIAISLCWVPYPISMALGIPGIVMSCLGKKAIDEDSISNRTTGLKLSIAGTVVSFVVCVIFFSLVLGGVFAGIMELY